MSAMYAKYKSLENYLQQHTTYSSSRGQGFATIAKEQLFISIYAKGDRSPATQAACAAD
jgi:hypothetical protein